MPKRKELKFWAVWRFNGCRPKYRHDTEASAITECKRLAKAQNDIYAVVEVIGVSLPGGKEFIESP
jgi:hypothetical protein